MTIRKIKKGTRAIVLGGICASGVFAQMVRSYSRWGCVKV